MGRPGGEVRFWCQLRLSRAFPELLAPVAALVTTSTIAGELPVHRLPPLAQPLGCQPVLLGQGPRRRPGSWLARSLETTNARCQARAGNRVLGPPGAKPSPPSLSLGRTPGGWLTPSFLLFIFT